MSTTTARRAVETDEQRADRIAEMSIEAFIEAGLSPADEAPIGWISQRYAAFDTLADGYLVASDRDEELHLQILTSSGVIRSEARFDVTEFGVAMFAAAAGAARQVQA